MDDIEALDRLLTCLKEHGVAQAELPAGGPFAGLKVVFRPPVPTAPPPRERPARPPSAGESDRPPTRAGLAPLLE